jgi:hypothetical protein
VFDLLLTNFIERNPLKVIVTQVVKDSSPLVEPEGPLRCLKEFSFEPGPQPVKSTSHPLMPSLVGKLSMLSVARLVVS